MDSRSGAVRRQHRYDQPFQLTRLRTDDPGWRLGFSCEQLDRLYTELARPL